MKRPHRLHRLVLLPGLLLAAVSLAPAAQIEGVLMDKMCSAKALKDRQKAAAMHTRDCALMPNCASSGYGVFTKDGKYLTFDPAGNEKAQQALQDAQKKDNLRVRVTGEVEGDTLKVQNLKLL